MSFFFFHFIGFFVLLYNESRRSLQIIIIRIFFFDAERQINENRRIKTKALERM